MGLDCLLLVRDPALLRVLSGSMGQQGIETRIAASPEDALATLGNVKFDSVMVDCVEFEEGPEILRNVRKTAPNRRAIVFAIVAADTPMQERASTGANFVLERPVSTEMLNRSLRAARSLMVAERRRYFRFKVDMAVSLQQGQNEIRVSATNISQGGMAVTWDAKPLTLEWVGQVEFRVPQGGATVQAKGEVAWVNADKQAGIRFLQTSHKGREALDQWLGEKADEDGLMPSSARGGAKS